MLAKAPLTDDPPAQPATSSVRPGLDLPAGPLASHAEAVFERVSPYDGDGFRNHCRRLFHFTEMLMARNDAAMDRDVAYAIAMCHDLGIVSRDDTGPNYLARSRALFERETAGFDLHGAQGRVVDECMLYNHRLMRVPNLSGQADAFRPARDRRAGENLGSHPERTGHQQLPPGAVANWSSLIMPLAAAELRSAGQAWAG